MASYEARETMGNMKPIPDIIISRLPVYLRALQHMKNQGKQTTSSQELGERLNISAAQIRKDLSQFGEFGKQGTGYNISFLLDKLREILKLERTWDLVIVGMGGMGHALSRYPGFKDRGFRVVMVFDNDPKKINTKTGEFTVLSVTGLVDTIRKAGIKIAMLCVPAAAAQETTNKLVEAGVKAILNYAPINLTVPAGVRVQYLDPSVGLQRMAYYLD
jgi:redox-sensing transcriptional repressor